jgi:cell division protein FtsZ
VINEDLKDEMMVTVIATGFDDEDVSPSASTSRVSRARY